MSFDSANRISTILVYGKYHEKNIQVSYAATKLRRNSVLEKFIKKGWEEEKKKNPNIFAGNLAHIYKQEFNKKSIKISTIHVTYDAYLVTSNEEFFKKFPNECSANPLSVGALVMTSDSKIILGKRSNYVATNKQSITIPSGMIDENDIEEGCKINCFQAVKREIYEEIGLSIDQIVDTFCMGVIFNKQTQQTFLPFFCKTKLSSNDILVNFNEKLNNLNCSEFSEIVIVSLQNNLVGSFHTLKTSDILIPTLEIFNKIEQRTMLS